jgi:hypothetical protein
VASVAPAPAAAASATVLALPSAGRRKLRVGVLADRALQPRWLVESLAKAAAHGVAEIAFVDIRGSDSSFSDRKLESDPFIFAYRWIDRGVFGDPASEPRDVTSLVGAGRRTMMEGPLDVAFALGDIDDASLDGRARYGVWRYCFGEGHDTCEALAGVSEVFRAAPMTVSGIRIRMGGGMPDRIACQSWARTLPLSVGRSRANFLAKTSEFLARALRDLHEAPDTWLARDTVPAAPAVEEPVRSMGGIARVGARVARRAAEKLFTLEQWSLAFRFSPVEEWNGSLAGFHRLRPPRDRFWADPFALQRNGRSFIFFEELPFAAGKAHISVVEVDRAGRASRPVRVLERDYHLSYPSLVEDAGELYMIPESAANNTIEIYRCVAFPNRWKRERVLLDGVFCADATVFRAPAEHRGPRWWMFANSCAHGADIYDELHLFSADTLLGEWKPHRRNPVKSDVRSARPAGNLFWKGAELHRPAQICAPIYGAGVAVNRVMRLDADGFSEEVQRLILPAGADATLGIHTINRAGDLSVADAFARHPRF